MNDDLTEIELLAQKLSNNGTSRGGFTRELTEHWSNPNKRKYERITGQGDQLFQKCGRLPASEIAALNSETIMDTTKSFWILVDRLLNHLPKEIVQVIREFIDKCLCVYWASLYETGPLKVWRFDMNAPSIPAFCVASSKSQDFGERHSYLASTNNGSFFVWLNHKRRLFYFNAETLELHSYPPFGKFHNSKKTAPCHPTWRSEMVVVTSAKAKNIEHTLYFVGSHVWTLQLSQINETTSPVLLLPTWQESVQYPAPINFSTCCSAGNSLVIIEDPLNSSRTLSCMFFNKECNRWISLPNLLDGHLHDTIHNRIPMFYFNDEICVEFRTGWFTLPIKFTTSLATDVCLLKWTLHPFPEPNLNLVQFYQYSCHHLGSSVVILDGAPIEHHQYLRKDITSYKRLSGYKFEKNTRSPLQKFFAG